MRKSTQVYTERFDEVLQYLVNTVGPQKWAEITRQMKSIYDINVPQKPMVQMRWKAIDPKINREPFTQEDLIQHWHFCIRHKCHWDAIRDEYELISQQRDKSYLSQRFFQFFTERLLELNRRIGKIASYNQQKIEGMRDTTKKRIVEFNSRDPLSVDDQSAREIIMSCKSLIKVMTYMVDNNNLEGRELVEEIKKLISPEKFQKVLFNVFIIDTIVLISCNELIPIDDTSDVINITEDRQSKFRKPKRVQFWNQALEEPSSAEHTEEDEILTSKVKINRFAPSTQFTKKDIEEIKASFIYKYCNTDSNKRFYNWYNEAKVDKSAYPSDLTIDVTEYTEKHLLPQEQPKRRRRRRRVHNKELPHIANKQLKKIEKKKNKLLRQGKEDEKIITKKGSIKLNKERFPGKSTRVFDQQSESESNDNINYQIMDADQVYKMHCMMNNQQFNDEDS